MSLASLDPVELTARLVDVESVSGDETRLADLVEGELRAAGHLEVLRSGNAVCARTASGRPSRVVLAGHLDTVPVASNLPARRTADRLHGCGTTDMKAALAVMLRLACQLDDPARDLTVVFYDCEEVAAERSGLLRLAREHPGWLQADLAVLMEPTDGRIEAGCQGTLRVVVEFAGRRAHTARAWLGDNAVHRAGELLRRLGEYRPREVELDGCTYREGLQAVRIEGGAAGNVVPDSCRVTINFRFAPDRSEDQALAHVREVLGDLNAEVTLTDSAPAAPPGLSAPLAGAFAAAVSAARGAPARAKYGWTDVARFAAMGIPALNYGPGDPDLAHTREESVELARIPQAEQVLRAFLTGGGPT